MKIMTQFEYKLESGAKCPVCRSEDVRSTDQLEHQGEWVSQDVVCNNCGASWTDEFTLSGFNNLWDKDENLLVG